MEKDFKKILIIAGDTSGDVHSANLMKEIKRKNKDILFLGIGGEKMEEQGLKSIIPLKEISVVGFWEVAKKYSLFKNLIKRVEEIIIEEKIDLFLPVDYPGFNLRIAKFAKAKNVSVVWYIAPQLWAWGENRAEKISKVVDELLVVFPFEKDFFEKYGIKTHFVGHPLLNLEEFSNFTNSIDREKKILLMPGSRIQEIKSHLPLLLSVNALINENLKEYQTVLALPKQLNSFLAHFDNLPKKILISNNSRNEMLSSTAGIIKSGTSNLEAALAGLPFTMFYKTSPITYFLGKQMIKVEYLSLVNLLMKKNVIKELIQEQANPKNIFDEIVKIIENDVYSSEMKRNFVEIRNYLGDLNASENAAEIILNKIFKK